MKKECEIVQDLLFGYVDGVLSQSSKELVEGHLEKCEICKNIMEELKEEKVEKQETNQEVDYLKNIRKKLQKRALTIILITTVLLSLVVFNIMVLIKYEKVASTMQIYLEEAVTQEQKNAIENKIKEICVDSQIDYFSKEQELEKLKSNLKEKEYLLNSYKEENNPLPASYQVTANKKEIEKIEIGLVNMSGIRKVVTHIHTNPYVLFFNQKN